MMHFLIDIAALAGIFVGLMLGMRYSEHRTKQRVARMQELRDQAREKWIARRMGYNSGERALFEEPQRISHVG